MFVLPDLKPEEVIMYLRKSRTDDPALTVSETVAKHEQMLDDFSIRTWGATIPEHNRFREIVSGETIAARPEVQKVLRLIEQDRYKAIIIVEPQRLSRGDLEDIGRLSKLLRYTHTIVITLQYSYDLTDERDRDYFERELKRGNEFLEYSKRIMHNGLRLCVENGYYMGSKPPYGYKLLSFKENKRTVHTLEILPDEAEAVRMIFDMYAAGKGAATICQVLNDTGVPTRSADIWRPPVIYRILDNPHYIGLIRYNFRKSEIVVSEGEIKKRRSQNQSPDLFPGRHEPIISRDLWDTVQIMRKTRHLPPVRSHLDIQNPLAGLVYCECGSIMVKAAQTKGRGIRMHCKDQCRCKNAGCTIDILLNMIAETLRAELDDIKANSSDDKNHEYINSKIKLLESRIESLKAKNDALWEKYVEDAMPKDTFSRLLAKNEAEYTESMEQLSQARSQADSISFSENAEVSLYATLDAISGDYPVKELNAFLKAVIKRITYIRKRRYRDESGNLIIPEPELQIELRF